MLTTMHRSIPESLFHWFAWFCFTLTPLLHAADLSPMDSAVVAALRRTAPTVQHGVVIQRLPVNEQFDLVLTIGWPRTFDVVAKAEYPWSPQDRLGLFMQDKTKAGRLFQLAVEPGPNNDCSARVERMTAQELVLSCTGEKGTTYDNQKFLYDFRAKALVKHFSYAPFWTSRVLQGRHGPQFVMSDNRRVLLIEVDPSTGVPRAVPDSEAHSVLPNIPMQESAAGGRTSTHPRRLILLLISARESDFI